MILRGSFCVVVLAAAATMGGLAADPAAAQTGTSGGTTRAWTPPRTPDGQPDIQGIWVTFDNTPFESPEPTGAPRPTEEPPAAGRIGPPPHWAEHDSPVSARRRSMVIDPPDGRIPVRPWAEEKRDYDLARVNDHWIHETPWVRCITRGFPAGMFPAGYNNAHQIIQIPGYVVIASEMIHETRIIPIDGRPPLGPGLRSWNGDSRGRWEGNTLIVETTNFNDKGSIATSAATGRMRGVPQTEAMRVVERFTPIDPDTIDYRVTVEDPKAYTRPWTVALPLNRDPNYQMYEYSCHEHNISIVNELSAGRARDRGEQSR